MEAGAASLLAGVRAANMSGSNCSGEGESVSDASLGGKGFPCEDLRVERGGGESNSK